MKEILCISSSEVKGLGLTVNTYLALMMLKYGNIGYKISENDLQELFSKGWIESATIESDLSPKAKRYFTSTELFEEFYTTFPHTVPVDFKEPRPLRTVSTTTNAAKATQIRWLKRVKGNIELQKKIIQILKAEINWREINDTLKYMNNIDTWLNNYTWEKYEYLLEIDTDDMSTDL